jgi:hypothetical protein
VFWKHPNTRLHDLGLPRNVPSLWDDHLTQIPVTVFEREDRLQGLPRIFAPIRSVRKIDVDWLTTEDEMRAAFDAAVDARIPVIVVFLHSFSFMVPAADKGPRTDHGSIRMFRAILDHVARRELPVVTMRDLSGSARALTPAGMYSDVVPVVAVSVDAPHYAWRRLKRASAASLYSTAGGAILVAAAALVVLQRRRGIARQRRRRGGTAVEPAMTAGGRVR